MCASHHVVLIVRVFEPLVLLDRSRVHQRSRETLRLQSVHQYQLNVDSTATPLQCRTERLEPAMNSSSLFAIFVA
jgi:hypothetical protein